MSVAPSAVLKRSAIDGSRPHFRRTDSAFGLEMMLLVVSEDVPFVQVPVRYLERIGDSAVTGDFGKAFRLGMLMIVMSIAHRIRTWRVRSKGNATQRTAASRHYEHLAGHRLERGSQVQTYQRRMYRKPRFHSQRQKPRLNPVHRVSLGSTKSARLTSVQIETWV